MQDNDALVTPYFKTVAIQDDMASKAEGRPIYRDVEVVEVRIAGDRHFSPTFPAGAMWRRVDGEEVTYAERWPTQYARFKANQEQIATGTPLSELPFLTEARRQELRALKIYTAEALASLEGKNLNALGITGRELKKQAEAYLTNAGGSAQTVALAAEVEALKAEIAAMRAMPESGEEPDEREALKAEIASITGTRPRGNPSVETLRDALNELKASA